MCTSLSSVSLLCGFLSLGTLLTAFVSNVWIYTKEPVKLPSSDIQTTVLFRIGLWRVCPSYKRINSTIGKSQVESFQPDQSPRSFIFINDQAKPLPSPACALIDYSSWDDVTHTDLGIRSSLEFTPAFISKMRLSMPFEGVSVVLLVLATLFALIGHCNGDHKTLIACTLYTLGGFSLAVGLIIFASVLSDAFLENAQRKVTIPASFHSGSHGNSLQTTKNLYSNHGGGLDSNSHSQSQSTLLYDYKYGWSFYVATVSFIMSEITAIISMTVYLKRFSSVEDMVRIMVPGGDRKLRQYHQNCQKKIKETDIVDPSPLSGEPLKSPIHSSTPSPSIADCKPGMGGESKVPDICTNAVHPKINRNDNLMGITVPIVTNNKKKVCKCKPQNRYNTVGNAVPNRRFNTLQPGVEPFSGLPNDTKYNSLDRYISGANRYAQDQTSSESSTSSILITNYKNNSTAIKTFNTLPHKNRLNRLDSQRLCVSPSDSYTSVSSSL